MSFILTKTSSSSVKDAEPPKYVTVTIAIAEDTSQYDREIKRLFKEAGVEFFHKHGDNRDGTMDLTYRFKDVGLVLRALPRLGECQVCIHR